jgi:hypothetical protein
MNSALQTSWKTTSEMSFLWLRRWFFKMLCAMESSITNMHRTSSLLFFAEVNEGWLGFFISSTWIQILTRFRNTWYVTSHSLEEGGLGVHGHYPSQSLCGTVFPEPCWIGRQYPTDISSEICHCVKPSQSLPQKVKHSDVFRWSATKTMSSDGLKSGEFLSLQSLLKRDFLSWQLYFIVFLGQDNNRAKMHWSFFQKMHWKRSREKKSENDISRSLTVFGKLRNWASD